MGIAPVTAATTEPLTVAEARDHLRVDITDDDTYVSSLITAARQYAEMFTRRTFVNTTFDQTFQGFPFASAPFVLRRFNLQSVTSISYVDSNGDTQTWSAANYVAKTDVAPGRVHLAYNITYPTARAQIDSVTVRFVAGYGSAATDVPKTVKQAMLLLIGDWYENREGSVSGSVSGSVKVAVEALLWSERVEYVA